MTSRQVGRGGLQRRFLLTVLAGTALFIAVAGAIAYSVGHARVVEQSQSTLEGLARAVEKTLAIGAFANDAVLLNEVIDGLSRDQLVASVVIVSMRGDTLAQSAPESLGRSQMFIDLPLASPFDATEQVGMLHIGADDDYINAAAIQEAYTFAALMSGQAALISILLYVVAALLVSRPIVTVARNLQAMSPGTEDRLTIPKLHQRDEIGILIEGANALLDTNSVALQRERELRAEVEAMEAQYRNIFDSSSAGIFVLDSGGQLINANPTVFRVVGLSLTQMHELQYANFFNRVFADPEQVHEMVVQAKRLKATVSADLELVQQNASRRWVHCLISVQDKVGSADGSDFLGAVEGVVYDITDRKKTETAVKYRAEYDALTGLKNRAATEAALDRMIAAGIASDLPVSLLCIDLDGFKQVNDELGHHAGDQVLLVCAKRMREAVQRSSDLVGRLGGDEFLIVLYGLGPSDAKTSSIASTVRDSLSQPVMLENGVTAQIGACIGVACFPRHGNDRARLTHAADVAMYEVKRTGKNSFAMACDPGAISSS